MKKTQLLDKLAKTVCTKFPFNFILIHKLAVYEFIARMNHSDHLTAFNYNLWIILLSIVVAILASFVALNLAYPVTQSNGKARIAWLGGGSLAMGTGIWSMHFIGMLAFHIPGKEMAYDIPLALLSVVVAISGSLLALIVISRPVVNQSLVLVSGVAMAMAITGMHYIGMYSMRMAARIEWDILLVIASFIIALGASYTALTILIKTRTAGQHSKLLLVASFAMGLAIAGMHYVGMIAATFKENETIAKVQESNLIVSSGLVWVIALTTFFILGLAFLGTLAQRIMRDREYQSEEKYRLLVGAVKDYAIFMIDEKGSISTWTRGAQKMTGYSELEVIGKHISILGPSNLTANTTELELTTATKEGHFETESIRQRKDGSRFWAHIVIDPLLDNNQKIRGFSSVIRDITDIKELNETLEKKVLERTEALQQSETQLRIVTNAVPQLLARLDKNENLLFANSSFCHWFDVTKENLSYHKFADLLGEERYRSNKSYIDRVLKGETVIYERRSKSKSCSSTETILNVTYMPEYNDQNEVKGFILVANDVRSYKEIEEALQASKKEADVANQTKSAFLANMSHEIRTPLGAILGFSELLTDPNTSNSEKVNMTEIIKRNGKLLSAIINDILDLSKIEAGELKIEKINLQLKDLIQDVYAFLNLEATSKGLELKVEIDPHLPKNIKTDPTRLRQILYNVIGNAIKFTQKGSIKMTAQPNPENSQQINFIIQDTGVGITDEQALKLFSPFTQADVTTTRKFGGTGLGLVLSKELAQALGGDVILAESRLNQGSTFVVSIELIETEAFVSSEKKLVQPLVQPITVPMKDTSSDLTGANILLVDDSEDNLELIQYILNLAGMRVDQARNGQEGLDKALKNKYDLVLMDLQMPVMDGYEAAKILRENHYQTPIIALTAHAMKEERDKCIKLGFSDHVTKPIDRAQLLQTILHHTHFTN